MGINDKVAAGLSHEDLKDLLWLSINPERVVGGTWNEEDCAEVANIILRTQRLLIRTEEELAEIEWKGTVIKDAAGAGEVLQCVGPRSPYLVRNWQVIGRASQYTYGYIDFPVIVLVLGSDES